MRVDAYACNVYCVYMYMYVYVCICVYVMCICMCMYMYVYMCVCNVYCVYTYVYVCIFVYVVCIIMHVYVMCIVCICTINALSSNGLAPPSPDILNEMLQKHPQAAPSSLPSGPVPPSIILSESGVLRGARSFPKGSAPGPSGLRPSHIREAVGCPSQTERANY